MNKNELVEILKREGVRSDAYTFDGSCANDQFCLVARHGIWYVYYTERGLQIGKTEFATESEACEYLLQELRDDPTTKITYTNSYFREN